jgi:hypothetical protein
MLPTRYVDILSSYLSKYNPTKDQDTQEGGQKFDCILARVYPVAPNTRIEVSPGAGPTANPFQLCIDYNTPKGIRWNTEEALGNFDLQLRDQYGEFLPFSKEYGCEYALTCFASET